MSKPARELRPLGATEMSITPVALGCWPMSGVGQPEATHSSGVATVHAALDAGLNHFDTADVYGPNGESDQILAEALASRRAEAVIASKVGVHYEGDAMVNDARPKILRLECEELLKRLKVDQVDLLYLHSPDPEVPMAETAGLFAELKAAGKTRSVGLSNHSLDKTKEFAEVCELSSVQLPYNMLQRGIERETLPWCREHGVSVIVYWPLMKGLLSGRYNREHVFREGDSRKKYPMYVGEEWRRNQDLLDDLSQVAKLTDITIAQLVVNWTFNQPGITSVLCGAKQAWQIEESAAAMDFSLSEEQLSLIKAALERRGDALAKREFR